MNISRTGSIDASGYFRVNKFKFLLSVLQCRIRH